MSKYVIDAKPYHNTRDSITWENSSLRAWLNSTFKTTAFTSNEQQIIIQTHLEPSKNPRYSTDPGNATDDDVFLLTIDEANTYFTGEGECKAMATTYAINHGVLENACANSPCYVSWWLRSPGGGTDRAANVSSSVNVIGGWINNTDTGVRPALWIDYAK